MADAVLSGIGKNILWQLGSEAVQEIGQWWNVKHELNKLENTVSTIQAVLLDAEKELEPSHQFRHWLGQLRHVLYDAEEVVDDFATEALRQKVMAKSLLPKEVRFFFSSSNQLVYGRKMANKIKEIREALDDITNDRLKFHFSVRQTKTPFPSSSQGRDNIVLLRREENVVLEGDKNVVGREVEKKAIIDRLLGKVDDDVISRDGVPVISIVGSGGLGKTTLGLLVYDDSEVKSYFELRMWVFVGDVNFSTREIAEKATKYAIETKVGQKRETEGDDKKKLGNDIEEFKKLIHGKTFLLVLDDIWSEDHNKWANLQDLWGDCRSKSRVIITTRSADVAKMLRSELHRLRYLLPSDSWNLFVKIVFAGKEPEDKDVLDNGKKIVAKCGGVPLAIKTIGNMLYSLNPETEWLPYVTNELSKYPQANNNIFPTLQLCYDNLPSPLKCCFAYCSLFPKGYIYNVQTLIQLWIAQGYIRDSKMRESLEDIGLQYCKVLVSRSFFEEEKVDEILGNIVSCRMHHIMHELASFVAGDETVTPTCFSRDINKNTRHLLFGLHIDPVHNDVFGLDLFPSRLALSLLKARKLRSLVSSLGDATKYFVISADECDKIFKKLTSLLVLDLSHQDIASMIHCVALLGCVTYTIPKSISKLKHLRYLDLSRQEIEMLPKSVTKLCNLQVLKLFCCENLKELPKDIKKLVSLRHLDCSGCDNLTYMPCGMGELTSLQTLTTFIVAPGGSNRSKHMAGLHELEKLNLRDKLEIAKLGHMETKGLEYQSANLKQKDRLLTLWLSWSTLESRSPDYDEQILQQLEPQMNLKELNISHYIGFNFPTWLLNLHRLVNLQFCNCKRCQYLPPLGELHSLKSLEIRDCHNLKYIDNMRCSLTQWGTSPFFPSLKSLVVYGCRGLEGWWNTEKYSYDHDGFIPQFPCLSKLKIENCPNLTCMPLFPTLCDELHMEDTSIEPLQQTLKATVVASTSSSSSSSTLVRPLSKLKNLSIWYMWNMKCLPEKGMQHLVSLQRLDIYDCRHLKERCGNKNGADWHKIFHIPNIRVEGKDVQIDGRYQLPDVSIST